MIDKLVEFGKKLRTENSHDAIRYERIHMAIIIDKKGSFLNFIPQPENTKSRCESILAKKGKARLLVDKVEETLAFDEKKHSLYIDKLTSYNNLDVLNPVFLFYDTENGLNRAKEKYENEYKEKQEKTTMNYVFRLHNDDKNLNEYDEVIEEIKKRYEKNQLHNKTDKICSICGKNEYPITDSPHGGIKNVPNGQSSGCALVSYNEKAFESYNLSGNLNSNICERCAKNYTAGLNELLSNHIVKTGETGKDYKSYTYKKRFGSDSCLLFWLRNGDTIKEIAYPEKPDDLFSRLDSESIFSQTRDDAFKVILNAIHSHDDSAYKNVEDDLFYAMVVSGESARICVRSWVETSASTVKENIAKWFYDIALFSSYDKKTQVFPIYNLVTNVSKEEYSQKKMYEYLWNAALFGKSIPIYALKETIQAVHFEVHHDNHIKKEQVSLLKLILNRLDTKKGGFCMNEKCDESNRSTAYVAGRIFALYEQIQYVALGDVNAGIREKFFTSASTTPSRAFGRLANMCQKHISKLEKSGSVYYDKELQKLFEKIECFPTLFSLEEQGQFVIGYYHQKQKIYTKKENKENENE